MNYISGICPASLFQSIHPEALEAQDLLMEVPKFHVIDMLVNANLHLIRV